MYKYKTKKFSIELLHIEDMVKNILKSYNIVSSSVYIYEYPLAYILKLTIFINNKIQYIILKKCIKLIKSILVLKYNKNIEIDIKVIKNMYEDLDILGEHIKQKTTKNPETMVRVMRKVLKVLVEGEH